MHAALWEAVRAGLVFRQDSAYKFLHDRIQQAAYSLIPEEHRADVHLRIGRVLLASMTADELAEHLFDVANQLQSGRRTADRPGRESAGGDDRSARRAKGQGVDGLCVGVRRISSAGMALLDESDWGSQYELMFSLWLERAECEYLTGQLGVGRSTALVAVGPRADHRRLCRRHLRAPQSLHDLGP